MCYCWLVLWGRMALQVLHHCDILILSPRSTLILHCLFHHLFGALHHPTSAFYSHHVLGTQSGATRATRRFFVGLQGLVDQIRRAQTSSLPLHLSRDERPLGDFLCQNHVITAFFLLIFQDVKGRAMVVQISL